MSFRRKLIIAFSIVSLLPLILTIAGFEVVRRVLPRDAAMVPKRVIITLGVMVVVILMVTALLMISWIKSSILDPINQLKTAMSRIRDGNLDYRLTTEEEGEIGELYQGYEDMRLRLKYVDIPSVLEGDVEKAIRDRVEDGVGNLYVLVNYTALFSTRNILKKLEGER